MKRTLEPEYMDTEEEADDYDGMDHVVPNESFVDRLFELGAAGLMLDVGCGPGRMPPMIVERDASARVVGVDAAETMLAHARRHRCSASAPDRIDYVLGDAKGLAFGDNSFDVVFSNTVLHHIPNPVPFLSECARVVRPDGLVFIRDLFRPADAAAAEVLVARHAVDASPRQRELFRASLHAALEPTELADAARAAGMSPVDVTIDSDRHVSLTFRKSRPPVGT